MEDKLPKGYGIEHWTRPDQWLVYKEATLCKCCGQMTDGGRMARIGPREGFTTFEAAKEWLTKHLTQ